ncbi:peptidase, partial [candidate division GN15 bacterium]
MIENLKKALAVRIQNLPWMSEPTKQMALKKLSTFTAKIGYPDKWRDYSALTIDRSSYVANLRRASEFEYRRQMDKIGKPVDRTEWGMPPQTINAYYNPLLNEICFPAAILQPPVFDGDMDDAVNYGAMGAVIGHEISHGFDDQGSQFDADGNMKMWWTEADRAEFDRRAEVLVKQFDGYVVVDSLHINGKLTLGENIGDLAGLLISYDGLQLALAGKEKKLIDGFTPEQRFFLSYAQAWRTNQRPEGLKLQVNTDPHSPAKWRVLGPLSNMPAFRQAFGCKEGDAMVRPDSLQVQIW